MQKEIAWLDGSRGSPYPRATKEEIGRKIPTNCRTKEQRMRLHPHRVDASAQALQEPGLPALVHRSTKF